jgi:dipeptide/tripeptide permease
MMKILAIFLIIGGGYLMYWTKKNPTDEDVKMPVDLQGYAIGLMLIIIGIGMLMDEFSK